MPALKSEVARRPGRPRRGRVQPLTLDRIVAAALRITDAEGLAALSMRRLGTELGVDPMAVYHHVPGKDALLQVLVGTVFSRMDLDTDPEAPWRERVEIWARSYRDLIRLHPSLVLQITSDAAAAGSAMMSVSEPLYAALGDAGLSDTLVAATADTLVDFLNGHGLGIAQPPSSPASVTRDKPLSNDAPTRVLTKALRGIADHRNSEVGFTTGLNIILEGALAVNASGRRRK